MKRLHPFLILTGVIGALTNILAIISYLRGALPLARWKLSSGLVLAATFVLLAYSLTIWSSLTWRWARARPSSTTPASRRGALFLLNLLLAFPLLVLWAYTLISTLAPTSFPHPLEGLRLLNLPGTIDAGSAGASPDGRMPPARRPIWPRLAWLLAAA